MTAVESHSTTHVNRNHIPQPDLATTYSNMALVYSKQGDYARSLEYNEKALAIKLQALGPDHEFVVQGKATIARLRALV